MVEPEPIPLGVSDPEGHVGAIACSSADIDLIDLDTGQRLRRLPGIGIPLMIDREALLGWQCQQHANRRRLFRVALAPSASAVDYSEVFDLPAWVEVRANADTDFACRFERDDDSYVLFWKSRGHYRGGAPPPSELQAEIERQVAFERIDFDAATLAVLRRHQENGFADATARAQRGEQLARQARGFVYRQAGQLYNAPWRTPGGERYLGSLGAPGEKEQRLLIVQGDTPEAHAIVGVNARELDRTVPELSLDGRHLAVVEHQAGAAIWRIYSAIDGARVATLPYREDFRSFRIFDRRLLYLEETASSPIGLTIVTSKTLHAVDTADGRTLWSYHLEPTSAPNLAFPPP
jgi:hypothetical protein